MNTTACGGNKKARLRPRPISALPPPNCWQALCAAREKIAHAGENLSENTVLVLEVGLEPTKAYAGRSTVSCDCHYTIPARGAAFRIRTEDLLFTKQLL